MTLTKGAIVQYIVPSASPFDTVRATFAPGVTPTPIWCRRKPDMVSYCRYSHFRNRNVQHRLTGGDYYE
nr:MAG TPA: hypothetical protein [Caudoviricetes sp.]